MTDPYGIIDLAALKQPAGSGQGGNGGGAAGTAGTPAKHEVAVTEQGLEQLVADSQQIPTLLLVTSSRVTNGAQFLGSLRRAVDAQGGAIRLATVDADTQQRVAAALRVEQLPTLMLLILGQVQPIVQAVLPDAEIDNLITQVLEVARQQGMDTSGAGQGEDQEPQEEPLPPLIAEAYEAIEKGDLDAAVAAYEKQLSDSPADAEAKAGLATVSLMRRTQDAEPTKVREDAAQRPGDLDAQLLAADLDMLGGHVDDAFGRLLDQLRGADQETKDVVRARLLELFEVAGPADPRVAPARKRLANLLF
ncbi:co-chaperone YbbN [Brachybacterium sp. GCM10030267]|uniref:co-chaperone YbbN n=1 Tax=Brachybacterium sp. GCM10030267 TaxID=3273381 RepID=UPI00360B08D9